MKKLMLKGVCFLVGNGKSIDAWKDLWIPWLEGYKPTQKDESILAHPMSVASLINLESRSWNMERLEELFDTQSVLAITKNVIPVIPQQDKIIWIKDTR